MKVLVACEFSGIVRDAFIARGHDAISCDLEPSERPGPHIVGDVLGVLSLDWDMMLAFPPCTYLCASGIHWNRRRPERAVRTEQAVEFVKKLLDADIPKIALENPIGILSTRVRKPDQIIQPWQFGEDASKATCLWLKGLPELVPTGIVQPRLMCGRCRTDQEIARPVEFLANRTPCKNCGRNSVRRVWANQTPSGQNKLGPSPTRAADRARTYEGIARAMAEQWG